jgi:hypothetical protein
MHQAPDTTPTTTVPADTPLSPVYCTGCGQLVADAADPDLAAKLTRHHCPNDEEEA